MKKISCLIVDDEPLALKLLEGYVNKTPFLELRGQCTNAVDALVVLNNEKIDLVFLDIQMPDLNGLELSRKISNTTRIIFTTAFEEYALEGYKVEALDYLLKPFNYDDFCTAAVKAQKWFGMAGLPEKKTSTDSCTDYIFVKSEYKQIKIILRDILYIEGLKDYVKIWLQDSEKPVFSLMSLKSLEAQLPENIFMRVHRSYIVNLNKINTIERGQIVIKDIRITIAEQYKESFQKYISGKSII
jgi:DNA-binding LytR/AlgR family response regulator